MTKEEFSNAAIRAQYNPDNPRMTLITVYDKPIDHPGKFVARLCHCSPKGVTHTDIVFITDTLDDVIDAIPQSAYHGIGRSSNDEPHIVGVWI